MLFKVGERVLMFLLLDVDMESIDLVRFQGKKYIVFFFYVKDGIFCCIKEVIDFLDYEGDFYKQDCIVFGISCDDCLKYVEFCDKEGIGFDLLLDIEGVVCK